MDSSFFRYPSPEVDAPRPQSNSQGLYSNNNYQPSPHLAHLPNGYIPNYQPQITRNYNPQFSQQKYSSCYSSQYYPLFNNEPAQPSNKVPDSPIIIDINIYVNSDNQAQVLSKLPNLQSVLANEGFEKPNIQTYQSNLGFGPGQGLNLNYNPEHFMQDRFERRPDLASNLVPAVTKHFQMNNDAQNFNNFKFSNSQNPLNNRNEATSYSQNVSRDQDFQKATLGSNLFGQLATKIVPVALKSSNQYDDTDDAIFITEKVHEFLNEPTQKAKDGFIEFDKNQIASKAQSTIIKQPIILQKPTQNLIQRRENEFQNGSQSKVTQVLKITPSNSLSTQTQIKALPLQEKHASNSVKVDYDYLNCVNIHTSKQEEIMQQALRPSTAVIKPPVKPVTETVQLFKRDLTAFKNDVLVIHKPTNTAVTGQNMASQVKKIKYFWRGTNFNYPYTHRRHYQKKKRQQDDQYFIEIIDFSKKVIQPNLNIDPRFT